MNGNIKKYIYTIGTIFVVFFLISIFLRIIPWLLVIGVIGYIIMKAVKFIKGKIKDKKLNNYKNNNDNEYVYEASIDDYTNGEIIDVDYEDVGDKNN